MARDTVRRRDALKSALAVLMATPLPGIIGTARAATLSASGELNGDHGRTLTFGTLGTEGSNHSLVLRRYLEFRRVKESKIELFNEFPEAFEKLATGSLDFLLQVSVHPSHTDMVARFFDRVHMVDVFIAPSKPLAVVTRKSVQKAVTIGLQPATRYYTDLSAWSKQIDEISIASVEQGLLAGRYDSGLTARELAEQYPERFRIDREIGAATDAWVLFARIPIQTGQICAWPEAPVTKLFD